MSEAIKATTPTYRFKLINFDFPSWGDTEHANWKIAEAILSTLGAIGVSGTWENATAYVVGDRVVDTDNSTVYLCEVGHTSPTTGTFIAARTAQPTYWSVISSLPVWRGTWAASTVYNTGDIVVVNTYDYYFCTTAHTSGATFAGDSGNWQLVFQGSTTVTAAQLAETNAETAETNAAASASAASTSASDAATSASTATTQASNAATSASTASTQATNASNSASAASTSASNAATSETNAGNSATAAAGSASAAATSASNAATSETNAATSATSAATSASALEIPDPAVANTYLRRNTGNTAYEANTPAEVSEDLALNNPITDVSSTETIILLDIPSMNIRLTGTGSITGFGVGVSGLIKRITFATTGGKFAGGGGGLLTFNNQDLVWVAGDCAWVLCQGSNIWRVIAYQKADGTPFRSITLPNAQTTASGTAIDFASIPATAKRVTVMFYGVGVDAATEIIVQIGTTTPTTSGYASSAGLVTPTTNTTRGATSTAGFVVTAALADTDAYSGSLVLERVSSGDNTWLARGVLDRGTGGGGSVSSAGHKLLASALGMIRITTASGAASFDAGNVSISYEV